MMNNWTYSQTIYPRILIINKDTVVAITRAQAVKINLLYSRLDQYKEINDSLLNTIDSCRAVIHIHDVMVASYNQEIDLYKLSITDRDTLIALQTTVIDNQKKQIKKLKNQSKITSIAAIVLGIVAIGAFIF